MIFVLLSFIFIVFVGLLGSVLRKKFYKQLLGPTLSFNALIVFSSLVANANDHNALRVFCVISILVMALMMAGTFYICYESKRRDRP